MIAPRRYALVLSIYISTRGFAFALFESALSPVDWGVKELRGSRRNRRSLANISKLLNAYRPDILVLQDTSPTGTHRTRRIVQLNTAVRKLAHMRDMPVFAYSRQVVDNSFNGFVNKHHMAEVIAKHVPAFERFVPPPRKPWMSEDSRMGIFDATALALVFFQREGGATLG